MSIGASTAGRPKPGLLTNAEVADYLSVELPHVRRLVHEKRMSCTKWGHLLRFDPADLPAQISPRSMPSAATHVRPGVDRKNRQWLWGSGSV